MADDGEQKEETPLVSDGPFTLNIPGYGREMKFRDFDAFGQWAAKEHGAWQKIDTLTGALPPFDANALTWHHHFFDGLAAHMASAAAKSEAERDEGIVGLNNLARKLERGEYMPLSGRRGVRFKQLVKEDPAVAVAMVILHWVNTEEGQTAGRDRHIALADFRALIEASKAEFRDLGLPAEIERRLEKLVDNWEDRATAHVKTIHDTEIKFATVLKDAKKNTGAADKAAQEMLERHEAEFDRIAKNYETFLTLKKPATYWQNKKWTHLGVATVALIAFGGAVYWALDLAWTHRVEIVGALPRDKNENISFGGIALFTLPILAFFWFLRLISRIFVTNLHHMSDAGLRKTMVTTFHALIKDETSKVQPDERLLVLQALFRPAGEGGDDAAPTNLLERLVEKASKSD